MKKFEIVTACVNHAHFLKETLPLNKRKVDHIIVVTSPTDFETHKVCQDYDVECIKTDLFFKGGAPFNRGLALNEAFKKLKYNDWVIHLDSDIILSKGYEQILKGDNENLVTNTLYGTKRVEIKDREEYLSLLKEMAFFIDPTAVGEFINDQSQVGCGFFQMFDINSETIQKFKQSQILFPDNMMEEFARAGCPEFSNIAKDIGDIYPSYYTCGGSDVHFRSIWQNFTEINLPVLHLGRDRDHSGKKIFQF